MEFISFKACILTLLITVVVGCGGSDGSGSDTTNNGSGSDTTNDGATTGIVNTLQASYGSWKYVHDGTEVYITSNTTLDISQIDANLLEVNDNGSVKYLIRNGVKNVNLSGVINTLSTNNLKPQSASNPQAMKASTAGRLNGVAGINVILRNVQDESITSTATTDEDGVFTDSSLPAGTYNISASNDEENIQTQLELVEEMEDVGNLVLSDSNTNNFKTELIMDDGFVYSDGGTYSGVVRVHNISQVNGIGLSYSVVLSDKNLKSFHHDTIIGSIQAGQYKDIPISVSFDPFLLNERQITLSTKITDINYNEWIDNLYFKAYRNKFRVNLASQQSNIRGYISLPNRQQGSIDLSYGYIDVPSVIGEDYYIALSNPDFSTETSYSIGYESSAADLTSFNDTGRYESQNGSESGVINIESGSNVSAYLHAGDIDFYKIQMDETASFFTDVTDALRNKNYQSRAIVITDEILQYSNLATLDSGTIILNGVDVGNSVNIQKDDALILSLTSPNSFSTRIKSTLTIGEIKSSFTVTTSDVDTSINNSSFINITDAFPATNYISNGIIISGINTEIVISTSAGTLIKNDIELGTSTATVVDGDTIKVQLVSASGFNSTTSATVSFDAQDIIYSVTTRDKYFPNIELGDLNTYHLSDELVIVNDNTNISIDNGVLIKNNSNCSA